MWPQVLVAIAFNFVAAALTALAAPKPPKPKASKLDIPKASEGSYGGIILGTILIKNPTVYWSGAQRAIPVRKKGGKK